MRSWWRWSCSTLLFHTHRQVPRRCPRSGQWLGTRTPVPTCLSGVACCDTEDNTGFQVLLTAPGWVWLVSECTFLYPLGADRSTFLSVHPAPLVWATRNYISPHRTVLWFLSYLPFLKVWIFILSCCLFLTVHFLIGGPQQLQIDVLWWWQPANLHAIDPCHSLSPPAARFFCCSDGCLLSLQTGLLFPTTIPYNWRKVSVSSVKTRAALQFQ